ncbi:hypothetical protein [Micromonospora sp. HUAS LYJ1]|uniref:hypothetical protein n=1 Tax=Micromonospora sp. HUAS LYJ1 TaxID=3061626 RepID=UPI002673012A|nr:hypothetical protein [Micromonospora sp. HUAS LYJ1]WKU05077.1 hypothetical protein Q2K16_30700 [Micromonospora sp. HUAS LYJ1]
MLTGGPTGSELMNAGTPVVRRSPARPLLALCRNYPVSLLVLAPYGAFVLPIAVYYDNPQIGFILRLLGFALFATILVETVMLRRGSFAEFQRGLRAENSAYPKLFTIARIVAVVSMSADIAGAAAGRGTIVTQVYQVTTLSPVARYTALVAGWSVLAFALLAASYLGGQARLGRVLLWTSGLVLASLAQAFLTTISAYLVNCLSFVAAAGVLLGVLKVRHVAFVAVVLLLLWPALFAERNEIRQRHGIQVSQELTAGDRLRFDQQVTGAAQFDVPVDVGQPGVLGMLRYGLVPRVLDPERPQLSTGQRINETLGGSSTSVYTFLTLGTVYFLEGPLGVFLFYGAMAGLVALLLRSRRSPGPVRLCLLCIVVGGPLTWSSTYPDTVIGASQKVVAALPIFAALWLTRARPDPDRRTRTEAGLPVGSPH